MSVPLLVRSGAVVALALILVRPFFLKVLHESVV
jgi:hypothetical protein